MMPVAWIKGHRSYSGPSEPDEYDEECYAGSDPPDNEPGWTPLYPKTEWQPIETAPKDGTDIDVIGKDHNGQWKRWCDAYWFRDYEDHGEWRGPWSDGFESPIPGRFKPTHWMPVPEVPP